MLKMATCTKQSPCSSIYQAEDLLTALAKHKVGGCALQGADRHSGGVAGGCGGGGGGHPVQKELALSVAGLSSNAL